MSGRSFILIVACTFVISSLSADDQYTYQNSFAGNPKDDEQ